MVIVYIISYRLLKLAWNYWRFLYLFITDCYCGWVTKLCPIFVSLWTAACWAPLSSTLSWSLLTFMSIESLMQSNHLFLCCPLLLLPSVFPSVRVFSHESALCICWPKYWNFSVSPSNEYSGLISFRIDWFYLLAIQGTLKSPLQHEKGCSVVSVMSHSLGLYGL